MKAIAIREHGGPEAVNLLELPDPVPKPGEVVVAVKAAALNHLDIWVRTGWQGLRLAFPHVLGSDVAGVIEAIGAGVEGVKVGDAVVVNPSLGCGRCERCLSGNENLCRRFAILGEHVSGGMAELAVSARNVLPKPENLSFVEAAAIPSAFMTAWHALVARAQLRLGETVLVHAAGSGVGVAAVQIAKLHGARVIATAGSDEKLRRAKDLGADEVVNYETRDFVQEVRRLTDKRGVEVVFEHVGKKTWENRSSRPASEAGSSRWGRRRGTIRSPTSATCSSGSSRSSAPRWDRRRARAGAALRGRGQAPARGGPDHAARRCGQGHALLTQRAQFGKIVLEP